jgi:hypothetical protein
MSPKQYHEADAPRAQPEIVVLIGVSAAIG